MLPGMGLALGRKKNIFSSAELSSTKYIHTVAQLSPPPTSRTLLILQNWNYSHSIWPLHPPPQTPGSHYLLSVSMDVTPLGTSYKGNPTVFVLSWLIYFIERNVLEFHPCSRCQNSLPFQGWITVHCVDGPRFVCPFTCRWTLKWLLTMAIVDNVAINMGACTRIS